MAAAAGWLWQMIRCTTRACAMSAARLHARARCWRSPSLTARPLEPSRLPSCLNFYSFCSRRLLLSCAPISQRVQLSASYGCALTLQWRGLGIGAHSRSGAHFTCADGITGACAPKKQSARGGIHGARSQHGKAHFRVRSSLCPGVPMIVYAARLR